MSEVDDIDAALQARAQQDTSGPDDGDDIDKALRARAASSGSASSSKREGSRSAADAASGALSTIGNSVLNIPHGFVHGVGDLTRKLSGNADAPETGFEKWFHVDPDEAQQRLTNSISDKAKPVTDAISSVIPDRGTVAGDLLHNTAEVAGDVGGITGAVAPLSSGASGLFGKAAKIEGGAQGVADNAIASQSMGAAGAATDVSKLTPETQAHLSEIAAKGGKANPTALANHAEAETLPVPVRLTRGQALEDESIKTQEHNSKQQQPEIGKRYDEQDEALRDNLDTFHREAAPTAVGNDIPTNDQAMIDSLKRYDAPKKQAISEAYDKAKQANGGDLPMDGNDFVKQAKKNLAQSNRADFLPKEVQGILDKVDASGGKLTIDQMESYRTILGEQARKAQRASDGTAAHAIGNVRDALENTQALDSAAPAAKALYDKARGLAKDRFDELKADPAYDAAVHDDTPAGQQLSDLAGKFGNKYVLAGNKANLQKLRAKLDDEGHEAMTSTGYSVLKDKAGVAKDKFVQNGYNTALEGMRRKGVADELLGGADRVEDAAKLGRVAKKVQVFSRGAAPNTSGTLTGALAMDGLAAARGIVPSGINKGIDLLGGHLAKRSAAKSLTETLRAGAGLED